MSKGKRVKKNGQRKREIVKEVIVPKRSSRQKRSRRKNKKANPGSGPVAAAYGSNSSIRQFSQRKLTVEGCDLLATIAVAEASLPTGTSAVLGSVDLNPAVMIPGGRLSQFAALFDKYQYNNLEVFYVPNVGTTTNGCLQIVADPDPLDDYSGMTGDSLNQALVGQINNLEVPVYRNGKLSVKGKEFFSQPLFVDPDVSTLDGKRWTSCGKIWWACMGPLAAATSYGRLFVRYKITFMEPSNDAENAAGAALIATLGSAFITSAYPWGDFSQIKADFTQGGPDNAVYERPYVTFKSDPTLGSVIQFNAQGYYTVAMARTGVAMGTGAYTTELGLVNCVADWGVNQSNLGSWSQADSNSGSTASMYLATIYASQPGAYMHATNDSGVTHSTGIVVVSKLNIGLPGSSAELGNFALNQKILKLDKLLKELKVQSQPAPAIGPALTMNEQATITTPGINGGPATTSTVTVVGTVDNGLEPVNVVTPGLRGEIPKGFVLLQRDGHTELRSIESLTQ